MSQRQVRDRIERRARRAGIRVEPALVEALETYLSHLHRWNRKINLTSLSLDPLTDDAVDRLIIEPLAAAGQVRADDLLAIDVGSGGGSPAIPMRLAVPTLNMVLVESKVRKCAFLREVIRQLELPNVEVSNSRFEELLVRPDLHESADIVTFRAVRAAASLWNGIQALLRPEGRVFWFGSGREPAKQQPLIMLFTIKKEVLLTQSTGARLSVLERVR